MLLHVIAFSLLAPPQGGLAKKPSVTLEVRFRNPENAPSVESYPYVETGPVQAVELPAESDRDASDAEPLKRPQTGPVQDPVIPVPVDYYFKSSELDEQPGPDHEIVPAYPPQALTEKREGWVRLLLLLDEEGKIRDISVLESSPPDTFDAAAIQAFRDVRFHPGRRHGANVKSRMVLKVQFSLQQELYPLH